MRWRPFTGGEKFLFSILMLSLLLGVWFPLAERWIVEGHYGTSAWEAGLRLMPTKHEGLLLSTGERLAVDPLGWWYLSIAFGLALCAIVSRILTEALWMYRHPLRNRGSVDASNSC